MAMDQPRKMQRTHRTRTRSQGVVMVESLLGLGALVLLMACICFMHAYTSHQIESLQEARDKAWHRATHECFASEPIFQNAWHDIAALLDGVIPTPIDDSASFAVPGLFGATVGGTTGVAFVCTPMSSRADPLKRPVDWVLDMF
jgi:hypothetical protein